MNEIVIFLLCGGIVFTAYTLEGITGFGSAVLSLPFLAMLLGLKTSVPLLCVLSWVLALYIVLRSWRSIQWKEFLFIVFWTAVAMPVGILLFNRMSSTELCILLGAVMVGVGIHGSIRTWYKKNEKQPSKPAKKTILMRAILFCGGIIHGAFSTGGPFVVIYAAKALPEKKLFRVTLSLLWLTLNTIRITDFAFRGAYSDSALLHAMAWAFPFMLAGLALGDFLHRKVDEFIFRMCVYLLLALAGCIMLGANIIKLTA